MQQSLISVVGPTATGKSAWVVQLAEQLLTQGFYSTVAIISADSRQVYRGLELVSGADIPADFEEAVSEMPHFVKKTIYGEIQLYGLAMIAPTAEWSLATFQEFAHRVCKETWKHGGLVVVVGGTGLYQDKLFTPQLSVLPGPDETLRKSLENSSLDELQQLVKARSEAAFLDLTPDDQKNRRRLIRVLERQQKQEKSLAVPDWFVTPSWQLRLGFTASIEYLEQKIAQRVEDRLFLGAVAEVETLLTKLESELETTKKSDLALLSATGVKEICLYLDEVLSLPECAELWARRERQYAKRQLTWWKKNNAGSWYSVEEHDWQTAAVNQVLASMK